MPVLTEKAKDHGTTDLLINRHGRTVIHTVVPERAANIADDPSDLALRVRAMNRPEIIIANLFTIKKDPEDGSLIHYVASIPDGGKISLMQPTSPYGKRDVLISAIPSGFERSEVPLHPDGEIRPHTWFDLAEDTRRGFSDASIAVLTDMHRASKPGSEKAIYMQNFASRLSPVTSQSQLHLHGHTVQMQIDDIHYQSPQRESTSYLTAIGDFDEDIALGIERGRKILEDQLLMRTARNAFKDALTEYSEKEGIDLDDYSMGVRQVAPYGVALCFDGENPITVENATTEANLQRIYNFRTAIASVYPEIAQKYDTAARKENVLKKRYGTVYANEKIPLLNQPARQELVDFTPDGYLRLIVVPMLDRVGPVEQLEVLLERTGEKEIPDDPTRTKEYARFTQAGVVQITESVKNTHIQQNTFIVNTPENDANS